MASHKQVMIVEDNSCLRWMLADLLSRQGYQVTQAGSLQEAREGFERTPPHLIIVDWNLPDGQGLDLILEWRAGGNTFPILMLSGRMDPVTSETALAAGANQFLFKPVPPEELIEQVEACLPLPHRSDAASCPT